MAAMSEERAVNWRVHARQICSDSNMTLLNVSAETPDSRMIISGTASRGCGAPATPSNPAICIPPL